MVPNKAKPSFGTQNKMYKNNICKRFNVLPQLKILASLNETNISVSQILASLNETNLGSTNDLLDQNRPLTLIKQNIRHLI